MPAQDGWTVWICGSCKRRVPGRLQQCRCGGLRDQALGVIEPESAPGEAEGPSLREWFAWPRLAMVGSLAFAGWFWLNVRPAEVPVPRLSVPNPPMPAAPARRPGPVRVVGPPATRPEAPPVEIAVEEQAPTVVGGIPIAPRPKRPPAKEESEWPTIPGGEKPKQGETSELDKKRALGRTLLEMQMDAIASTARQMVPLAEQYESSCGRGKESDECERLLDELATLALRAGSALDQAEDISRKYWLEPGDVRALRERRGLSASVWDKLARLASQFRRR
jgi:hypothetical protein